MPVRPVLTQGYPLFITCSVKDVRSIISHDAPYLTFELPEMSRSLENEVVVSYRLGMCICRYSNPPLSQYNSNFSLVIPCRNVSVIWMCHCAMNAIL